MEKGRETERFEELLKLNEDACRNFKAVEDNIRYNHASLDLSYFESHYVMMKSCYDLNKERLRLFKSAANRDHMTQAFLEANRYDEALESQALHEEALELIKEYSLLLSNMRGIIEDAQQSLNRYSVARNYSFEKLIFDMRRCNDSFVSISNNENSVLTDRMGVIAKKIKCWTVSKAIQEKLNGKVFVKTENGYEEQK